jgi:hypothetical protein
MRSTPYYRSATSVVGFLAGGLTGLALASLARVQPWPVRARRRAPPASGDAAAPAQDGGSTAGHEPAPVVGATQESAVKKRPE